MMKPSYGLNNFGYLNVLSDKLKDREATELRAVAVPVFAMSI